jgi:hypothetical protein
MTREARVPPLPRRVRGEADGPAPGPQEGSASPLPQRQPGKTSWPTPITRATPPKQLESLLESMPKREPDKAEGPAPGKQETSASPLPQRQPGKTSWPTPITQATPPKQLESLRQRMRAADDAPDATTAPIPVISASAGIDLATPDAEEITAQKPDRATEPERAAEPDRATGPDRVAEPDRAIQVPAKQAAERAGERPAPARRHYRGVAAAVSALVLIAAGALTFALYRHSAGDGHGGAADPPSAEVVLRNHVAAWVAEQVSRTAVVSCDQAMCQALIAHGIAAGDLLTVSQGVADPLHSGVIVATAAVRSQFSHLISDNAPAVLASFGSGNLRIDVRVIAPGGTAAYRSEVSADLQARKTLGAQLLNIPQIVAPARARAQLSAGQVDYRLLVTIEEMASRHALRIVAFGDSGPGASPGVPLRSADLAEADVAPGTGASAYVRSMLSFLHSNGAVYVPAHASLVRLAGRQIVLRIEFAAPSPLAGS